MAVSTTCSGDTKIEKAEGTQKCLESRHKMDVNEKGQREQADSRQGGGGRDDDVLRYYYRALKH
jgi:hypothetical protein